MYGLLNGHSHFLNNQGYFFQQYAETPQLVAILAARVARKEIEFTTSLRGHAQGSRISCSCPSPVYTSIYSENNHKNIKELNENSYWI